MDNLKNIVSKSHHEFLFNQETILKMSRLSTSFFLHLELPESGCDNSDLLVVFSRVKNMLNQYFDKFSDTIEYNRHTKSIHLAGEFYEQFLDSISRKSDLDLRRYLKWIMDFSRSIKSEEKREFFMHLETLWFLEDSESYFSSIRRFMSFINNLEI